MNWRLMVTIEDADIVRTIRNEGRQWLGNPAFLSADDQRAWFDRISRLPSQDFRCYLTGEPPIGYGMVQRRNDGRLWITLAVRADQRGLGTGTAIYDALARSANEPIYAGIRRDNVASWRAAEKANYRLIPRICPPDVPDDDTWVVLSRGG